jgi:thiamine biosynthesis lipoprotein
VRRALLVLILVLPLVVHAAPTTRRFAGETMGTTWSVSVVAPSTVDAEVLQRGIQAKVDTVDRQMSTWKRDSDLSRFNRAPADTWQTLPPEFFTVLSYALELARDTGGAYDPTVGPLVNLWGFGPERHPHEAPSADAIAAARVRVGWQRIRLDPATRRAWQPGGAYVDLSSVAKGFSVDEVARYLDRKGATAYLVEVGGELRARGTRPDGAPWHVGIERPGAAAGAVDDAAQLEQVIALRDRAIATSGDYRHFFESGVNRYSHHIDPRSGKPVTHAVASVSVIAVDCMHADSLGTTMTVLGPDEGMAYARRHGLAVLFILRTPDGFEERMSPAFAAVLDS